MRHIFLAIVALHGIIGSLIESESAQAIVDTVVAETPDTAEYEKLWIDTVMYAGGHSFGYSGDVSEWGGWYYDTIPVGGDRMLRCDSVGPTVLRLNLVTRDLTVDLASATAKDRIVKFMGPLDGFKRFDKVYIATIDSAMDEDYGEMKSWGRFSFVADYADPTMKNAEKINRFVCQLAAAAARNVGVKTSAPASKYIGHDPGAHSSKKYRGALDILGLSDFIFAKTLKGWRKSDIYSSAGVDLAIASHIANSKFVTFGVYAYGREGTGHGMYTETFHSFDLESGKELTNDKLFKPHALDEVKLSLFDVMAKDPRYANSYRTITNANDVRVRMEGRPDTEPSPDDTASDESDTEIDFTLPQGALTDSGVVFSFQPYEIDCWAAGAYHFIVPYDKLMPHLTERAKALITNH